jgi:hypothetical protein
MREGVVSDRGINRLFGSRSSRQARGIADGFAVRAACGWDYELRLSQRAQLCSFGWDKTQATKLVAFFFPAAGLFVSTQYEIPFKLIISTFHASVMAITPAIASHKVRHPSC